MKHLVVSDPFPLLGEAISQKLTQTFSFFSTRLRRPGDSLNLKENTFFVIDIEDPKLTSLLEEAQNRPDLLVLVSVSRLNLQLLTTAMKFQLKGAIMKSAPEQEWHKAVTSLFQQKSYLSDPVLQAMHEIYQNQFQKAGIDKQEITEREMQVLELIVEGLTTKEIAGRLSLGTPTIDTHRIKLMNKLGVNNCASLVREAFLNGLLRRYHENYGYAPHVFS